MTVQMRAALEWIAEIADKAYADDPKLRADGARQFKRISDKARAALAENPLSSPVDSQPTGVNQ